MNRDDAPALAAEAAEAKAASRVDLTAVLREFFSHFDNAGFGLVLLLVMGVTLAEGLKPADALWFALGWALFLPQEWLTHVHLLHWICPPKKTIYRWMYRLHYGHHDLPNRHDLMYMPLWLTLPMTAANYALFVAIAPTLHQAHAAFSGALVGYLLFEGSHLICHVPMPVSGLWARIRARHLAHHFVDETRCFSVSPPAQWIDRVTGLRARGEGDHRAPLAARSPLCRTLVPGLDPTWIAAARRHFAARSSGDLHRSRLWLGGPRRPRG
jgi:hypothetical protein